MANTKINLKQIAQNSASVNDVITWDGSNWVPDAVAAGATDLDSLTDVTITANTNGEILKWNGSAWVNNTLAEAGIQPTITPAALTKVDDTNVTLTLGGTPATALLQAASITLGWTGQLAVSRGGTGASTLTGVLVGNGTSAVTAVTGTANQLLRRNAGNTAYEFFTPTYLTANQTITLSGDVTGSGTTAITTTIANAAVTLAKMANVNTATVFYRKTGGTGAPEVQTLATLKTDLGLTGTNSGDQTITLTGDVTGTGTGSFAATIANNAVTTVKINNLAVTDAKINDVAWSKITSKPTTLAGYGITDAVVLNNGNSFAGAMTIGTNDNNALNLETAGVVRMSITGAASTGGAVTITNVTANTSTVQDVLTIATNSTGAAAAGLGPRILLQAETGTPSAADNQTVAAVSGEWSVATHASRRGYLKFYVVNDAQALVEAVRIEARNTNIPAIEIPSVGGNYATYTKYMQGGLRAMGGYSILAVDNVESPNFSTYSYTTLAGGNLAANLYITAVPTTNHTGFFQLNDDGFTYSSTAGKPLLVKSGSTVSTPVRLHSGSTSNYIGLKSPDTSIPSAYTITLPSAAPANNSVLNHTTSGTYSWATFTNGIDNTSSVIGLGGNLTGTTAINAQGNDFALISAGVIEFQSADAYPSSTSSQRLYLDGPGGETLLTGGPDGSPSGILISSAGITITSQQTSNILLQGSNSTAAAFRFYEGATNGTNYVGLKGPDSVTSDYTITLPSAAPSSNTYLKYNGSAYVWDTAGGSSDSLDLTTVPTVDTANGVRASFTAGETLAFAEVVYIRNSTGAKVFKYDANDATYKTYPAIGVATAAITSGNTGNILLQGVIRKATGWAWTIGQPVYASITAGGLSQTPPGASGEIVQIVGVAIASDAIYVNPQLIQLQLT